MVQGGQAWCVGRSRGAKRGHFDEQREVADRPGTGDACQDRQPLTEIATGSAGGEKLGVDGGESRRDLLNPEDEHLGRPPPGSGVRMYGAPLGPVLMPPQDRGQRAAEILRWRLALRAADPGEVAIGPLRVV